MRYIWYVTKSLVTNKYNIFWGLIFMIFWLAIGAFVFGNGLGVIPSSQIAIIARSYTSGWFGTATLFSFSAIAVSSVIALYHHTGSLPYAFRYTRLTPSEYLLSFFSGTVATSVIYSIVMTVLTYTMYSAKFGFDIPPNNLGYIIIFSILSGMFMMSFAMLLEILMVRYIGVKNSNFVSFIPLILGFVFGYAYIFISGIPSILLYLSPYNAIEGLLYFGYAGSPAPLSLTLLSPNPVTLSPYYLAASLVMWTILLSGIDVLLFRKIQYVPLEEARHL